MTVLQWMLPAQQCLFYLFIQHQHILQHNLFYIHYLHSSITPHAPSPPPGRIQATVSTRVTQTHTHTHSQFKWKVVRNIHFLYQEAVHLFLARAFQCLIKQKQNKKKNYSMFLKMSLSSDLYRKRILILNLPLI